MHRFTSVLNVNLVKEAYGDRVSEPKVAQVTTALTKAPAVAVNVQVRDNGPSFTVRLLQFA